MKTGRRTLAFSSLAEVMPEVDRLLSGHRTVGNWTLGQICNHLTWTFTCSIDGFPVKLPWLFRKSIGPLIVRRILTTGRMPEGIKLPEKVRPRPGLGERAEAEALRAALRLFAAHPGPFAEHPLSGRLPRETWEQIHRIHCAHHLGFVLPGAAEVA